MCLQIVECVEKAMRQFAILYRNAKNLLKSNIDVGARHNKVARVIFPSLRGNETQSTNKQDEWING